MIRHNIKVAFRNLWKYKYQTLVSVIGLAVGFACFAMATLWIRYEMSFDSFHKNADRMYCVNMPDILSPEKISRSVPVPLAKYLKETFPEIVRSTTVWSYTMPFEYENVTHSLDALSVDSTFFEMFGVKIVEGNMDYQNPMTKIMAMTREKSLQLFGNESPVGKEFKIFNMAGGVVGAIVTEFSRHSNYPFDVLRPIARKDWYMYSNDRANAIIELLPDVDVKAFEKKLYEHTIAKEDANISKMTLTPLTKVRYTATDIQRDVKFHHIVIFSVVGSLLILCTLFNYLTLFISRFRIRQREFALRAVYGASNRSLFTMLSVEFLMSLFAALLLGAFLIDMIVPSFVRLSGIKIESLSIYFESLIYIAGIIVILLLTFILALSILRRRTLNAAIRSGNKKLFRKISIATQLVVSIGFAFCSVIIVKQMYYLHNTDLGFAFENRGSVTLGGLIDTDVSVLYDKMQQIPEITETVRCASPLIPARNKGYIKINSWDEQPEKATPVNTRQTYISEQFMAYYDIKIIEGEMLSDRDTEPFVLINESMAKSLGWYKSSGKSFDSEEGNFKVKGVIKNIYSSAPTVPAEPAFYSLDNKLRKGERGAILFKYNKGDWKSSKEKIEAIVKAEYPPYEIPSVCNTEEEYDKFLKSENALLKILSLVSLVCMIVCVFGFVSIVALTCEERRKEIAIRKIHGATIKDILDIFFKEYLMLLIVGALIAFPAGYLIMKRWLEGYVLQTEMNAWIYAAILLALIMAIVLCVGKKVYKTSRENPVEAIKS